MFNEAVATDHIRILFTALFIEHVGVLFQSTLVGRLAVLCFTP